MDAIHAIPYIAYPLSTYTQPQTQTSHTHARSHPVPASLLPLAFHLVSPTVVSSCLTSPCLAVRHALSAIFLYVCDFRQPAYIYPLSRLNIPLSLGLLHVAFFGPLHKGLAFFFPPPRLSYPYNVQYTVHRHATPPPSSYLRISDHHSGFYLTVLCHLPVGFRRGCDCRWYTHLHTLEYRVAP